MHHSPTNLSFRFGEYPTSLPPCVASKAADFTEGTALGVWFEPLPNHARFVGYPILVPCFMPITAMLVFLRLLGMVLNGTSSFLYGFKTMRAIFYAIGPDIRPNTTVPPFENVNIYPLIAEILGLDTTPTDGDLKVLAPILRKSSKR
jgi:hypothetical protein